MSIFLGDTHLRDNGCSLLRVRNRVLKIAVTSKGIATLQKEKEKYEAMSKDAFFSRFLLPSKFHWRILSMPFAGHSGMTFVPEEYFKDYFSSQSYREEPLSSLIDPAFITDLIKEKAELQTDVERILSELYVQAGSVHGDFHSGNVVYLEDSYYFIDVGDYKKNGSPFFDLFHYSIFPTKQVSWTQKVLDLFQGATDSFYGVKTSKKELIAYVFHMISQDLAAEPRRKERRDRYIALIEKCCSCWAQMNV